MLYKTFLTLIFFFTIPILISSEDLSSNKEIMLNQHLKNRGITSIPVLKAMENVPREEFVLKKDRSEAYDDRPLAIGHGQTISQPYIVAYMTELLNLSQDSKVLEIGTGSGYQAAILAKIAKNVYSVEIIEALYLRATKTLNKLGFKNIKTRWSDGYYGWEEHAPYDAIIVTCAAKSVPPNLIKQLKKGGIICIPVGQPFSIQVLYLIKKINDNDVLIEALDYVQFVPLTRDRIE